MTPPVNHIYPPFYVIPMPINAQGEGPCTEADAVEIRYEVWDELCLSYASFSTPEEAHAFAGKLNYETEH